GAARRGHRGGGPVPARQHRRADQDFRVHRAGGPAAPAPVAGGGPGGPPPAPGRAAPHRRGPGGQPGAAPPTHRWAEREPAAAARLAVVRATVAELAERYTMPTENLIPPDAVRRISWEPPDPPDPVAIEAALSGFGARRWQVELTAGPIAAAIAGVAAPQPGAEPPGPGLAAQHEHRARAARGPRLSRADTQP